jgi:hypothetical protein
VPARTWQDVKVIGNTGPGANQKAMIGYGDPTKGAGRRTSRATRSTATAGARPRRSRRPNPPGEHRQKETIEMSTNQMAPAPAHYNVKVGDDVWYCIKSGDCEKGVPPEFRPAKVVKHYGSGTVNVAVWIDGANDTALLGIPQPTVDGKHVSGLLAPCTIHRTSVSYNTAGVAGSWCFPRK